MNRCILSQKIRKEEVHHGADLFYRKENERPRSFIARHEALGPAGGVAVLPTIDEFSMKIAQRPARQVLAVMKPRDEEALIDIYFTRCLFRRIPSILVLPDRERHTSALAFRIGPTRVFPCGTNHREIVAAVSAFLNEWQENTISGPDKYSAAA